MKPRDYQDYAVNSIFGYFENGGEGNPIVVMPTGTGKSIVIGEFVRRACTLYPTTRVMKLTHVKELIKQNLDKLLTLWPTAPAGVYSSGLGRKDVGFPIVFGGVQSVAKAPKGIFGRIDLLLIDECHLLSPKDGTMYQAIIALLKADNPHLKVVGFTATHYRLGQGTLVEPGSLFTDICVNMATKDAFNWFLDQGYLCPLIPKRPGFEIDVSDIPMRGGEYIEKEVQAAVDKEEITYAAIKETVAYGHDRRHWLLFAAGVDHAINVKHMLDSFGVDATCVHSKMLDNERDDNIADFLSGKYRAMVNNGILTTGFDFPGIDLISILRPTQSTSLWVQMLGRGTRPVYAPGFDLEITEGRLAAIQASFKHDCLVLDFAGNIRRLGPVNDPVLPRPKGKKSGTAPVRLCTNKKEDGETCNTYNHASATECCVCGFKFPREVKFGRYASTDKLIARDEEGVEQPVTQVWKVDRITYIEHRKEGRPPSIQVTYFCGLQFLKEFVCFEHGGPPTARAHKWWKERSIDPLMPTTTLEALKRLNELKEPTHVRVWIKKPYNEIKAYDFSGTGFDGATS